MSPKIANQNLPPKLVTIATRRATSPVIARPQQVPAAGVAVALVADTVQEHRARSATPAAKSGTNRETARTAPTMAEEEVLEVLVGTATTAPT